MTNTVITGGVVFDGTARPPVAADLALADGRVRILAQDSGPREYPEAERIEANGNWVMPGLTDAHVHTIFDGMDSAALQEEPFSLQFYTAAQSLERTLDQGITTIRDAGGADLGVKTAQERGMIAGPRMRVAISVLSQTGGHADGWTVHGDLARLLVPHPGRPDSVVDGVEGMRRRVREVIRAGADVIKVCASGGVMSTRDDPRHPQFAEDELRMAVEEAAAVGLGVMAHAHGAEGIKRAVKAGVRSIEHGVYLDDEAIALMAARGTWLVPTLLAPVGLVESIDAGMVVPAAVEAKARTIADTHLEAINKAHRAGVRIAMGTDSGVFPHGSNLRELELMQRAGMSALEVLSSATLEGAELLGLHDVGRLEDGAAADVLVLNTDAPEPARFQEQLAMVFQDGRLVRGTAG